MANIVKLNYTVDEINQRLDKVGEIENTYATKDELEEVADSIRRWKSGTHYEIGDTVLVTTNKNNINSPDKMLKCIKEHTASNIANELNTCWIEVLQAASAVKAEKDNKDNIISSTYATKEETNLISSMLPNFKIYRLFPNETFEIEPNMLCFLHGGGLDCITFHSVDGDAILKDEKNNAIKLDAALFFSANIDKLSDPAVAPKWYDEWYRIFYAYGSKTSMFGFDIPNGEFGGKRTPKGAYLKNTYVRPEDFDANKFNAEGLANEGSVLIYYVKKGTHSIENETV